MIFPSNFQLQELQPYVEPLSRMIAKMNRELRDKGNFGLLCGALLREKLLGNGTWVQEEMNSVSHGKTLSCTHKKRFDITK